MKWSNKQSTHDLLTISRAFGGGAGWKVAGSCVVIPICRLPVHECTCNIQWNAHFKLLFQFQKLSSTLFNNIKTFRSIRTSKTCSSFSDRLEKTKPWLNSWLGRRRKAEKPFSDSWTKVPWFAWNCCCSGTEDVMQLDGSSAIIDKRPQTAQCHNTTKCANFQIGAPDDVLG